MPRPTQSGHKRTPTAPAHYYHSPNPGPTTPIRNPTFDHFSHSYSTSHNTSGLDSIHVSPTKALALSRLQHDIAQLHSWLESLFHPAPVPVHLLKWREEALVTSSATTDGGLIGNDDQVRGVGAPGTAMGAMGGSEVLEALKVLKQANLAADHLNSLVHDAEVEELSWIESCCGLIKEQRDRSQLARLLVDKLVARLSMEAQGALEDLGGSAVVLSVNLDGAESDNELDLATVFTRKLLELAHRKLRTEQQFQELDNQVRFIDVKRQSYDQHKTAVDTDDPQQERAEQAHIQTVQYNRDTKQINLKIMEYEDRMKGLQRQLSDPQTNPSSLQNVLKARKRVEQRKARIRELQDRVAAFRGLPPDIDASRSEIRRAINELESLRRKREGLFERMGTN